MEVINKVFVSKEISIKLEDLKFREPCIAYRWWDSELEDWSNNLSPAIDGCDSSAVFELVNNNNPNLIAVPTWEQVLEWFREKGFRGYIEQKVAGDFGFVIHIKNLENPAGEPWKRISYFTKHFKTYQEAMVELVNQLIILYECDKKIDRWMTEV